eukprot:1644321-Pyramimonas_sp.AAC.1
MLLIAGSTVNSPRICVSSPSISNATGGRWGRWAGKLSPSRAAQDTATREGRAVRSATRR